MLLPCVQGCLAPPQGCRRGSVEVSLQASVLLPTDSPMPVHCGPLTLNFLSVFLSQALKRDLHHMEQDVNAFAAALEDNDAWDWQHSLQQLEGRFRFLDGIYRAHSEVRI